MFKRTTVCRAALLALAVPIGSAMAQQQAVQRVEITGSNIKRIDAETASPVQVITSADLQRSGFSSVSEVLQNITANGQGTLSQSFNQAFAAGASGVSLRGLTLGATLVLIDGRRMAPYPLSDDGQRPFVDISSIPFSAVERIEVLKDGASSIYGSDAIAGVVNVILKKRYEGTQLSADVGTTQHGGGSTAKASLLSGFKFNDSANGYVGLEVRKQDQIKLSQRSGEWTKFDWRDEGGLDLRPGARNDLVSSPRLATPYLQIPGSSTASASNFAFYPGCTYADMRASNCTFQNTWAQLQPKTQNVNLIGRLNFELGSDWSLSVTGSWFQSKAEQTRSPSTTPFGSFAGYTVIGPGLVPSLVGAIPAFTVPANYPGNTLGVAANIRALTLGTTPRVNQVASDSNRLVAELNGSLAGWDINAAAGYTRVQSQQVYNGYVDANALYAALNRPNPFLLQGGNSQAAIDQVAPRVENKSTNTLSFIGARASRDLMALPGGALAMSAGVDFRSKDLKAPTPTQPFLSGAYAFGKENVTAAYAELNAPVLKSLELSLSGRVDHYDTYGTSSTPKAGVKFTPMQDLVLRGTVSRGFRAPNGAENGVAGSLFSFNAIRDPQLCPVSNANGTPNLTAAANVPSACNFNPTYLQGTSPNLQPEKSRSLTLGILAEPVKGWTTSLDYYKIVVDNQIIPAAALATFDPLRFVVRSTPQIVTFGDGRTGLSAVGPIAYVNTPYVNGQTSETSGLEFESRYRFDLGDAGGVTLGVQVAHMLNYDLTVNGTKFKLAGTHGPSIIGGNTGNPKDRGQFTLGWDRGPLNITANAYYVGSYDVTDPSSGYDDCASGIEAYNAQFANGATPPSRLCKIRSFTTVNLTAAYKFDKALTLRGTIGNLFDKAPPTDLQTYGGTGSNSSSSGTGAPYNPSLHQAGAVGRFFSVGLDYRF